MSTTNTPTPPRWYMVNRIGMATLCGDEAGALEEAEAAQAMWPHMGPHRAVQLAELHQEREARHRAQAALEREQDARARAGVDARREVAEQMRALRAAAQAVVDRWDSPAWKDLPHTAEYIDQLRTVLDGGVA